MRVLFLISAILALLSGAFWVIYVANSREFHPRYETVPAYDDGSSSPAYQYRTTDWDEFDTVMQCVGIPFFGLNVILWILGLAIPPRRTARIVLSIIGMAVAAGMTFWACILGDAISFHDEEVVICWVAASAVLCGLAIAVAAMKWQAPQPIYPGYGAYPPPGAYPAQYPPQYQAQYPGQYLQQYPGQYPPPPPGQ